MVFLASTIYFMLSFFQRLWVSHKSFEIKYTWGCSLWNYFIKSHKIKWFLAMDWMFTSSQSQMLKANPQWWNWEVGSLEAISPEGGAFMNEISALLRIDLGKLIALSLTLDVSSFPLSLYPIRPSKKITTENQKVGSHQTSVLALWSWTSRNKFLLFTIHPVYGILLQQLELRVPFQIFFPCFLSFHVKWVQS